MDTSNLFGKFIRKFIGSLILIPLLFIFFAGKCFPQLYEIETNHLRLVYYGEANKYLVKYVGQCFENALLANMKLYKIRVGDFKEI